MAKGGQVGRLRSVFTSLAGRLTGLFIVTSLLTLLLKAGFTYITLGPLLAVQEKQYVTTKAEQLVLRLDAATNDGATPGVDALLRDEAPSFVRILDSRGTVRAELQSMTAELPELAADAFDEPVLAQGRSGRQYWVAGRRSRNAPGFFVQVASEASEQRLLAPTGGRLWLASILVFALSGVIGYHVVRHGIRPLQELTETVKAIGGTMLGGRIDQAALPRELQHLGSSFNSMLDRLQQSFDRVAQVTDDIAHELRTPLGVMTNQIDVVLDAERSAGEYRETLESVREELSMLSDMVQRLLFLSRVENHSVPLCRDSLVVAEELEAMRDFYDPVAAEAGLTLATFCPDPGLTVPGDRVLLRRALGNLVANSIRYTPSGGRVVLRAEGEGEWVRIAVADTGRGIPATFLPRLFDRFFRLDRARENAGGHIGLGLAIVKAIVELHGGSVAVESELGRGTRVAMALPAVQNETPPRSG